MSSGILFTLEVCGISTSTRKLRFLYLQPSVLVYAPRATPRVPTRRCANSSKTSAGFIYVVQGYVSMSYSEENERGKFVTITLNMQALGAAIGGIIPLIINRNRVGTKCIPKDLELPNTPNRQSAPVFHHPCISYLLLWTSSVQPWRFSWPPPIRSFVVTGQTWLISSLEHSWKSFGVHSRL